jgi:hypothetical protein
MTGDQTLTKRDKRSTKEEPHAAQAPNRERHQEPNLSEDEHKEIVQFHDRKRNRRCAPKLKVISKPGEPLVIHFGPPVEQARFMSAFGTSERAHAELMLDGILKPTFPGFGVVVGPRIAPSPGAGNGKSRSACAARVEPIS